MTISIRVKFISTRKRVDYLVSNKRIAYSTEKGNRTNIIHFSFTFTLKKDERHLSKEWMLKTLESLGLKHLDAEVYVYLAQNEPQKAKAIAEALETYKRQLCRSLKSLQRKGMISTSQERPATFSAISFDKVLDQFIQANREEAKRIEENKDQILSMWRSKVLET
jgi:predicted transcriptional regulator